MPDAAEEKRLAAQAAAEAAKKQKALDEAAAAEAKKQAKLAKKKEEAEQKKMMEALKKEKAAREKAIADAIAAEHQAALEERALRARAAYSDAMLKVRKDPKELEEETAAALRKEMAAMDDEQLTRLCKFAGVHVPEGAEQDELLEWATEADALAKWKEAHPPPPPPPEAPPPTSFPENVKCAVCGALRQANGAPLLHCALCGVTCYCSEDHKFEDWTAHRLRCALLTKPPKPPTPPPDEDSDDEETKALIEESRRELLLAIGKSPGAWADRPAKGKTKG